VIVDRVVRVLERPLVVRDAFRRLDAIVVLGGPLGPNDQLTRVLAERARAAAALFQLGGGPLVVASGGVTRGSSRAEADVLAEELRRVGVPDANLVVERESTSTLENARYTQAVLARAIAERPLAVWLVTQPFHGRRAQRLFRRAGLDAHVWHIDDSLEYQDRRRALRWVLREYVSWAAMLVRGDELAP
jgi:uncharacterized SAM-binding protein YcdF (DUF218 family)